MSSCDIWLPWPSSTTWSSPEPFESLDAATGTTKPIAFVQSVMGCPVGVPLSYLGDGDRDLRKSAV